MGYIILGFASFGILVGYAIKKLTMKEIEEEA